MASVPVGESARRGIDHGVESGGEDGLTRLVHDGHEAPVDLAQHLRSVTGMRAHFLDDAADQCGQQPGADAVAHDVAHEEAAPRVGEADDVEEISAERRCGHVAMRETERTVGGATPRGNTG